MTAATDERLAKLEALVAEQDHTLQALDYTIAQQDRELARLALELDRLRERLAALQSLAGGDVDPRHHKPPHY